MISFTSFPRRDHLVESESVDEEDNMEIDEFDTPSTSRVTVPGEYLTSSQTFMR